MTAGYVTVRTDDRELFALISVWLTDEGYTVSLTDSPRRGELCLFDTECPGAENLSDGEAEDVIFIGEGDFSESFPDGKFLPRPFTRAELLRLVTDAADKKDAVFTLDTERRRLWCGKISISLSEKECRVMEALIRRRGSAVTKEELYAVAGSGRNEGGSATNASEVYICMLRRKIADVFGKNPISTVRGVGYIFRD
ncbi:MAG: winged helix-turn-helix domain-containing protein [Firmicutes bacterium]|nr:winged helix-turn-helix domain-containing protein [Bacillota bacterium]